MPRPHPGIVPANFLVCGTLALAQAPTPVFKSDVNLQSIAVQVTDKAGRDVRGLSAADFTVLEDGKPQKISFFGAEDQPISLAILLDSSTSMESGRKLAGERALLSPLLRGNRPEDEVILAPFTHHVGAFQQLTGDQRVNPPSVGASPQRGGTALYDALATGLCKLRTASNLRQAVVVITDGSDQLSRLRLEQMIRLVQSSQPQIFMIGFFDRSEYYYYRHTGDTVTLSSGQEIDNPVHVFERVARESGAESFFSTSKRDLQKVIAHILGILQAQYTVAYYPQNPQRFRRIQVKVNRRGVRVAARGTVGAEGTDAESVHFSATSCEVSATEHPYPWEPHTSGTFPALLYHDDFSDPQSGWPNRAGSHYVQGGYELGLEDREDRKEFVGGVLAAYGPWWQNFRASVSMEGSGKAARGIVFRLRYEGCYILLCRDTDTPKDISFKLVKRYFQGNRDVSLIPWTRIAGTAFIPARKSRITVECIDDRITILLNGVHVIQILNSNFTDGYLGMAHYGPGRTVFHDLRVEMLP